MTVFRNVSPLGALDVPAVGRVVEHGEEFEVRDDVAELLAGQTENYEQVGAVAPKKNTAQEKVANAADDNEGATSDDDSA